MTLETSISTNKKGRPVGTGSYNTRLPEVRVSSEKLNAYQLAAVQAGVSFSQWVRESLEHAIDKAES